MALLLLDSSSEVVEPPPPPDPEPEETDLVELPLGAGIMAAGLGPAGLGTPDTAAAPPTGPAGVRYLNPATRDYERDTVSGQLAQMPSVRQRVLLALMTTQESATSQQEFGIRAPKKIDSKFTQTQEQRIRFALRQLTDVEKVARVDSIRIERGVSGSATARVRNTVSFTDLTTGKSETVRT